MPVFYYPRKPRRARFCDANCRDSLREDRRAGVIHPAIHICDDDGKLTGDVYSVEDYSLIGCVCAYCGSIVPHSRSINVPATWTKKAGGE